MTNLKQGKTIKRKTINRRGFIGSSLTALVGFSPVGSPKLFGSSSVEPSGTSQIKEYRTLGRTGFKVSDISLGGASLTEHALVKGRTSLMIR